MAELYSEEKPVKKSDAKNVALWQERIGIAKKDLEQWSEMSGAKRFINEYRGDYGLVFNARNRKIPIPPINEVFAYVQSDIATTYNRDPYITVNATAGTTKGAALWETILNYYWRKLNTKDEIEYEIIDKDLVGYGFHKVGYAVDPFINGSNVEIRSEGLYSNYLSWRDVVWNVGSKRPPKDCIWMAHRIVKPLNEIKKKYPAAKGMEGTKNPDVEDETYKKSTYKDDIKVGVMWEIWDSETRTIYLIGDGIKDRYLEDPKPWPDYIQEFPFQMYFDFIVPDRARPMSAIAPWEAQILEEMIIMAQAINHAKRWNRQLFVQGGKIDENAMDKFERGDDGAIITINGKLDEASFKFADFGQLPTDFYLIMDRLQAIKRNINGQPEFVRGGVTKTNTRTIGELQLMQMGSKGRQDRKVDRLESHCENIARQMMACLKANFDFEQTLKISGDTPEEIIEALGENYDPVTQTIKFTPKDIDGQYDVDVKAGSTLPMDKQSRTQVLEVILSTLAQVIPNGPTSPFLNALIQELLRDYDIKSLKEAYEEESAQREQNQAKDQMLDDVDAQKTAAETAKRQAQAQQISIESVMKDQEAALGPIGRAELDKFKKSPVNGVGVP